MRYDYLYALRGYAVLGVVACHIPAHAPEMHPPVISQVQYWGAHGVSLFFMISAFTLLMSWRERNDGALPFYARRLFRIAPMFWIAAVAYPLLRGAGPSYFSPNGVSLADYISVVTFTHGWHPERLHIVVPGGWSIAIEMTFYLIFPAIAYFVSNRTHAWVALVGSVVLALTARPLVGPLIPSATEPSLHEIFFESWLFAKLPFFAVGLLAYYYREELFTPAVRRALSPAWACELGKISYSVFLLHFIFLVTYFNFPNRTGPLLDIISKTTGRGYVFALLAFAAVLIPTILLARLTFRLIEQPCIDAGNRLIAKRRTMHGCSRSA